MGLNMKRRFEMLDKIYLLIICHFIGDYVLQGEFIAQTKGKNFYHLIIHSVLYSVPFYFIFQMQLQTMWPLMIFLVFTHVIIDSAKATYGTINYFQDQVIHFIVLIVIGILI